MTALRFSEGQPFDRVERVVKPRRASSGPEETVSPPTILRHRTSLSSVSFLITADTRLFATTNRSKMSRVSCVAANNRGSNGTMFLRWSLARSFLRHKISLTHTARSDQSSCSFCSRLLEDLCRCDAQSEINRGVQHSMGLATRLENLRSFRGISRCNKLAAGK